MGYNYKWEPHRQTCYRLYVEQNLPLDETIEYMREHHDFTPSRRAFQGAFSRWGFPNKINPAYKIPELVDRVKELWQKNYKQKEMVQTLQEEGYEIGDREVVRIRQRNKWLMRTTNGYATEAARLEESPAAVDAEGEVDTRGADDNTTENHGSQGQGSYGDANYNNIYYGYPAAEYNPADAQVQEETLAAMREARREQRKRQWEMESNERWLNKKRRRHTKPYGGLPADPPGPPRFPSETTLTEAKEILQLDADAYKTVRDKCYEMCLAAGVYKKTICGPERWEELKDQLVRESMHLRAVFWDPTDVERKKLAVEIIACDVTKRIRTSNSQVKMPEAKRILGLDPEQAMAIRGQLYNILAQEKFTSKFEEGAEYFEALKKRWIAGSEELSRIVAAGDSDPDYAQKMKAIKAFCRDVNRRYHEEVIRKGRTPAILLPPEERPPLPKYRQPKVPKQKPTKKASAQATPTPTTESPAEAEPGPEPEVAPAEMPAEPAQPAEPKRRGRPKGSRNKKKGLPHTESRLVLASPGPEDQQQHAQQPHQQIATPQPETSDPMPLTPSSIPNPFTDETYAQAFAASMQARALRRQQTPSAAWQQPSSTLRNHRSPTPKPELEPTPQKAPPPP
ncbi:hypothetical protein N0V88_006500 [Collariella sp. IMI 366227]|nr:hypothetical protein N0V88_006500 [Collariella sp. IMI 366227]